MEVEDEKEPELKQKKKNEDWQIMGDLLFSIRHSAICRIRQKEEGIERKTKKQSKPHLDVEVNEWQTFLFEEYAASLFCNLRDKWLKCEEEGGDKKYVKRLFGETSESMPVQHLDINKSCKYYWRRLNTNSKSGMIFFQSVNGEYIIKSMPKSGTQFVCFATNVSFELTLFDAFRGRVFSQKLFRKVS